MRCSVDRLIAVAMNAVLQTKYAVAAPTSGLAICSSLVVEKSKTEMLAPGGGHPVGQHFPTERRLRSGYGRGYSSD
jgi:hypothetical protein